MKSLLHKIVTVPFFSVLFFGLAVSLMITSPLLADEFVNISELKDCQQIAGDTERLLCYDTVSKGGVFNEQQLKQVQVEEFGSDTMPKESKPAPAPVTAPVAEAGTVDTPSTVSKPTTSTAVSVDELGVTIVRMQKGNNRIYYFQTSEGQVWKQVNASAWAQPVPFDAKITKGLLGSFFLVNEGGKSTRVRRVR